MFTFKQQVAHIPLHAGYSLLHYKQRKTQIYRQEEIIEEIEVILLNAENLCLMVMQQRE